MPPENLVSLAQDVLDGKLDVLEACRKMAPYVNQLAWQSNENYVTIIGVESETDVLPIGDVRSHWDATILKSKELEIQKARDLYREDIVKACRWIVKNSGRKGD